MDNVGYTALTRQSGLLQEMQVVANNIANVATTGFRREGVLFSEHIIGMDSDAPSLSMARASARQTDLTQGGLARTGGTFDLAIEGEGFFQLESPGGPVLTRAGAFTPNEAGELVTPDGVRLLDAGGAPIFVPADARGISISSDGTISADGRPLGQVGLFVPGEGTQLNRIGQSSFAAEGEILPLDGGWILQGFLESSNVNAVQEINRMIEVQRAYELGAKLLEQDHERIRNVMQTLSK